MVYFNRVLTLFILIMKIDKKTPYGGIDISIEAIATVAGNAAIECYGVVGLSCKRSIKETQPEILGPEDFFKGVIATKNKNLFDVNLYIICAYGTKITEVVSEVQKRVKYVLETTFSIKFHAVNVYVQGLKDIN